MSLTIENIERWEGYGAVKNLSIGILYGLNSVYYHPLSSVRFYSCHQLDYYKGSYLYSNPKALTSLYGIISELERKSWKWMSIFLRCETKGGTSSYAQNIAAIYFQDGDYRHTPNANVKATIRKVKLIKMRSVIHENPTCYIKYHTLSHLPRDRDGCSCLLD
jgi:hypothetical protein